MTPRAILSTVDDAAPTGITLSGVLEFIGNAIRAGTMKPDGTLNPCRALRDGPNGKEFVLTSREVAAMSTSGKVWNADTPLAIPESAVRAVMRDLRAVADAVIDLMAESKAPAGETVLVIGGSHGFHPSRQTLDALPLLAWLSPDNAQSPADPSNPPIRIESVGDAVSLGAALVAMAALSK
jgi:hypothetical protein